MKIKGVKTEHVLIDVRPPSIVEAMKEIVLKSHNIHTNAFIEDGDILKEDFDDRLPDVFVRRATDEDIAALQLVEKLWKYAKDEKSLT